MKSLKEKRECIYKSFKVPFESSLKFAAQFLNDNDYFVPLNGKLYGGRTFKLDHGAEYLEESDDTLMKIYTKNNNMLIRKNSKSIVSFGKEYSGVGDLINSITKIIDAIIDIAPEFLVERFSKQMIRLYDKTISHNKFVFSSIYIWIPLWNSNAEFAHILSFFDRVSFIIT